MGAPPTSHRPRLEALFDSLREGFVVCEMVRDSTGQVVDYWIREANAAFLRGLGGKAALGKRLGELRPDISRNWFATCESILKEGKPRRLEYWDPAARRWYDTHMTPVSADELVMLYVDVTRRKEAEARQLDLFRELNHRVKNNLHVVSAMLSLQAKNADPAVRYALNQAAARIHTISEVHTILYRTGSTESVSFDEYLTELCERLEHSVTDHRITINVEADTVKVSMDQAVQLGIIVNELITNAVKHAYGANGHGEVQVRFKDEGDLLDLSVRDRGVGLPANDSRGLGMKLVRSLVQQCGGVLVLHPGPGAHLSVRLPVPGAEASQERLL